ncbi:MAG: DUF6165 family protein [Magnetococcus sp. DMHC-6]
MTILIPVSIGELFDKLTILSIKEARITDPEKLVHIQSEKGLLNQIVATIPDSLALQNLVAQLHKTNMALWEVEDQLRVLEREKNFSELFIHLARQVYTLNDHRFFVKSQINQMCDSCIIEEKSYAAY